MIEDARGHQRMIEDARGHQRIIEDAREPSSHLLSLPLTFLSSPLISSHPLSSSILFALSSAPSSSFILSACCRMVACISFIS